MFKDLKAVRGRHYIQSLINEGEHEHQDFKYKIQDARKIARSISAFANNDGGRLLVGVKDNGTIAGLRSEEDLHLIEAAAEIYCSPAMEVEMQAFLCGEGTVVVRCSIPRASRRPVEVLEEDGRRRAYFRVADENIAAHPLMVRAWRLLEEGEAQGGIAYSAVESSLLASLHRRGEATVEELMIDAHLSQSAAEDVIVKLASLGLVGFNYHPFRITIM